MRTEKSVWSYVIQVQDGPELLIQPAKTICDTEGNMINAIEGILDRGLNGRIRAFCQYKNTGPRTNLQKGQYVTIPPEAIMYIAIREGYDEDERRQQDDQRDSQRDERPPERRPRRAFSGE